MPKRTKVPTEDAAPFKIGGVYCRLIPLTKGLYAIVDAADYEWLMQWVWTATRGRHTFYAYRNDCSTGRQRYVSMHAVICPAGDGKETDHRNGNGTDNRRANLREASGSQQRQNSKLRSNNSTGHTGISRCGQTGLYKVRLQVGGHEIWLGRHASYEAACRVRDEAEAKYFGEFSRNVA